MKVAMKAYKAFDKDLKCRDIQFKVGETYDIKGKLEVCKNGLHFCKKLVDVFNYYPKGSRVCEVTILGAVIEEGDKGCTDRLFVDRELSTDEISAGCNSGDSNSGDRNSGNRNSGYYNSGDYNSGNSNSGYYNSGNRNSGHYNSGSYNSGSYNSGSYNSGFFNTTEPNVRLFNKESDLKFDSEAVRRLRNLNLKPILAWVYSDQMTDQEKKENPCHETTGGFLRNSGRINWSGLSDADFEFIKSLPNFDAEVFKKITDIDLAKPKTVKISLNNQTVEVSIEEAARLGFKV